jgi:hypothetical protein
MLTSGPEGGRTRGSGCWSYEQGRQGQLTGLDDHCVSGPGLLVTTGATRRAETVNLTTNARSPCREVLAPPRPGPDVGCQGLSFVAQRRPRTATGGLDQRRPHGGRDRRAIRTMATGGLDQRRPHGGRDRRAIRTMAGLQRSGHASDGWDRLRDYYSSRP